MTATVARGPTLPGVLRRLPARGERQVFAQLSGVCVQSLPRLSPANTLSPATPAASSAGTPRPAALIRPALIRAGGSGEHRHFPASCPPPMAPRIRRYDGVAVRRAPTGGGRRLPSTLHQRATCPRPRPSPPVPPLQGPASATSPGCSELICLPRPPSPGGGDTGRDPRFDLDSQWVGAGDWSGIP